jgi:hypothetical protein
MSRQSSYGSSWPTLLLVEMGQEMLLLQLQPPTSDFTATHPLLFTEVGEPLEADHWLRVIESKFGLMHYTEVEKTLFTTQ